MKASYSNGGKRSFFLVTTVELARQQGDRIKNLLPFNVAVLTGKNNVDIYKQQDWLDILNENQIFVMTAQCFYDAVFKHKFIDLKSVKVIIFDECHRTRKNHVYWQIAQGFVKPNKNDEDIRIIGLSGVLVGIDKSCKPYTVLNELKDLESNFACKATITANNIDDQKNVLLYSTKAKELCITYDLTPVQECLTNINAKLSNLKEYLEPIQLYNYKAINPKTLRETVPRKIKDIICLLNDFKEQTQALGYYGS